jgi:general secretion pathway protein D
MLYCKKLAVLLLAVALLGPLAANAKTRKGEKLVSQGRTAEAKKQYDEALDFYEQALSEDPSDIGYQLAMRRVRFQAGQAHVDRGLKLRLDGKTAAALAEFEKAYAIDPSSGIAEQEIRRTREMIERDKKGPESGVKPEDHGLTPTEVARHETQDRLDRMLPLPELKPLSTKPIDLKMNNQPAKVLFETVAKIAGINVVFDPDIPTGGKPLSIELNNSTVEEALDYLSILTKSFWKPLSGNTIFVTQDNNTKRRDYEDQVMKVIYLKNISLPQELQELATDVRTICDIRKLYTWSGQMAVIIRAEADKVALAEKLIADMDKPKAEVVIDILVLEHNIDDSRQLAFGLADGINSTIAYNGGVNNNNNNNNTNTPTTPGTIAPVTPTTPTTPSTTGGIALNQIQHLSTGQYSVVLPNASIQATLSKTNTRVLQSPQVRAANGAKTSLKIGEKVPTASGSFQPGIGGVGINPLVNTQFQFLDVGVNVEITPNIHGSDEIALHVDMDISTVDSHVNLGGIDQPVIGQKKAVFDVQIKEGQASVLGGLMSQQESKTNAGTPGLASIPLLGRLFSRDSTDKSTNELLFVLIPHIVRTQEITETNLKGIGSGSDLVVKLNYAPKRVAAAPAVVVPAVPLPAAPELAPVAPPAIAPPATAPPATAPPATAPPAGSARVSFAPARAEGQLGSAITVSLMVENVTDLFTAPLRLQFDPKVLRLNDVTPGNLLSSDGKPLLPMSKNIMNDAGEVSVTVSRAPGAGGVSGSGTLVTFVFQAAAQGTATVSLADFALRDSKLQQISGAPPPLTITVR